MKMAAFCRARLTVAAALTMTTLFVGAHARDFVLPNGQILKNVRVIKIDEKSLTLAHAGGIQQFEIANLPPDSVKALTAGMTKEEQTAVAVEARRRDFEESNRLPENLKAIVQAGNKVRLNVVVLQVLDDGLLCSGEGTDLYTNKPVALDKKFLLRGHYKSVAKGDKRTFTAVRSGSYTYVSVVGISATVDQWWFAGQDD